MDKQIRIAPSILSADFARLADDIARVEPYTDILHLDVMDGHFVPNITFGPPLVKCVRRVTKLFLDAHLMIEEPAKYIEAFIKAGADNITFHIEVAENPLMLVKMIKEFGAQVSVSLRPDTSAEELEPVIDIVDMVLVMTVMPGFGGQEFRRDMLGKIEQIRNRREELCIQVDGGINEKTIVDVIKAGANNIVAGTAVFGAQDAGLATKRLKEIAIDAQE